MSRRRDWPVIYANPFSELTVPEKSYYFEMLKVQGFFCVSFALFISMGEKKVILRDYIDDSISGRALTTVVLQGFMSCHVVSSSR